MDEIKTIDQLYQDLLNKQKNSEPSMGLGSIIASSKRQGKIDFKEISPYKRTDVFKTLNDGSEVALFPNYIAGTDNNERLAQNQSTSDKWLNGLTKAAVNFGTTVVGNTVGLVGGLGNGIAEGSVNAIFDNKFTNYLADLNEKLDYKLPNYVTKDEQDDNFGGSLFNANFWAKDVAGAFSFTLGTAVSEAIWAVATGGTLNASKWSLKAAQATNAAKNLLKVERSMAGLASAKKIVGDASKVLFTGKVDDVLEAGIRASNRGKWANTGRFLLTTSGNEAGIEALHFKRESRENFYENFEKKNGRAPSADDINEFEDKLGNSANAVFATNMAILAPSNLVMFGSAFNIASPFKGMAKGANKALFGIGTELVEEGGEKVFKGIVASGRQKAARYAYAGLKPIVMEGLYEEGLQGVTTKVAKQWMESGYDPKYNNQTIALADATYKAFGEQYGTKEGWKEIGIGGIVGGVSSVVSGRGQLQEIRNFDKQQEYQNQIVAGGMNKYGDNTTQATRNMAEQFFLNSRVISANERQVKAAKEGDDIGYALADQDKLVSEIQYRKGIGEDPKELISKYETALNSMPKEEYEKAGITDIDAYKSNVLKGYSSLIESHEKASKFADAIIGDTSIMGIDSKTMETQKMKDGLTRAIVSGQLANKAMDSILQDMGEIIGKDKVKAKDIELMMSQMGESTRIKMKTLNTSIEQADKERVILSAELENLQAGKDETKAPRLKAVQTKLKENLDKSAELKSQREELARDVSQESKRRRGVNLDTKNTTDKNGNATLLNEYITGEDLANLDKNLQKIEDTIKSYEGVNHEVYYDLLESKRQYGLAKDRFMGYQDAIDGIVSGNFKPNYAKVSPFWQKVFMQKQGIDDFSKAYLENILENYKTFGDRLGFEDVSTAMTVEENDYRVFQETGEVSDEIKAKIAQTIKTKEALSKRAKEIYDAYYDEINNLNKVKPNPNKPDLSPEASIDKEIEALEKEKVELLNNEQKNVTQNKEVEIIYDKLDKLKETFLKNGKSDEESDSLALASLTPTEKQVLRESYNKERTQTANQHSNFSIEKLSDFAKLTEEERTTLKQNAEKVIDSFPDDQFYLIHLTASQEAIDGIMENGLTTGVAIESTTNVSTNKKSLINSINAIIDGKVNHRNSTRLAIIAFDNSIIENKEGKVNYADEVSNYIAEKYIEDFGKKIPSQYSFASFSNGEIIVNNQEVVSDNTKGVNENQEKINKIDKQIQTLQAKKRGTLTEAEKVREQADAIMAKDFPLIAYDLEELIGNPPTKTEMQRYQELFAKKDKLNLFESKEFEELQPKMQKWFTAESLPSVGGMSLAEVVEYIAQLETQSEKKNTLIESSFETILNKEDAVDLVNEKILQNRAGSATTKIKVTPEQKEANKSLPKEQQKYTIFISGLNAEKKIKALIDSGVDRAEIRIVTEKGGLSGVKDLTSELLEEHYETPGTEFQIGDFKVVIGERGNIVMDSDTYKKARSIINFYHHDSQTGSWSWTDGYEELPNGDRVKIKGEYNANTDSDSIYKSDVGDELQFYVDMNTKFNKRLIAKIIPADSKKKEKLEQEIKNLKNTLISNKKETDFLVDDFARENNDGVLDYTKDNFNRQNAIIYQTNQPDNWSGKGSSFSKTWDALKFNQGTFAHVRILMTTEQKEFYAQNKKSEFAVNLRNLAIKNRKQYDVVLIDIRSQDLRTNSYNAYTNKIIEAKQKEVENIKDSQKNEITEELKKEIFKSLEITSRKDGVSNSTLKATGDRVTDDNFMLLRKRYSDEFVRILEEQKGLATLPSKIDLQIEAPISEIFLGTPDFILDSTNTPKELPITEAGLTKILSQGYVQDKEIVLADKKVNVDKVTRLYVSNLAKKNPGVKIPVVLLQKGVHLFVFPINLIQKPISQEDKFQTILENSKNFNEIRRDVNNLLISLGSNTRLTGDSDIQFENIREELKDYKTNISAEQLANVDYDKMNLINEATSKIDFENTLISSPKITVDFSKATFGTKTENETNATNIRKEIVKDLLEIQESVLRSPDLKDNTRFVKAFAENDVKNQGSDIMNRSDVNFIKAAFFNETGKIAINANDNAVKAIGKDKLLAFRKKLETLSFYEKQITVINTKERNLNCTK